MRHPSSSTRILLTVLLTAQIAAGQPLGGSTGGGSRAPGGGDETGEQLIRIESPLRTSTAGKEEVEEPGRWRLPSFDRDEEAESTGTELTDGSILRSLDGTAVLDAARSTGGPGAQAGGTSDARYALEQTSAQFQAEITAQENDIPSRQLVDVEMRWDGSEFLFSSIFYPVTGNITALIDADEATFTPWATSRSALNGRWLDLEVEQVGGQLYYAGIFYEDGDDYAGTLLINADESLLEGALFSDLDQGMTVVDFESWQNSSGETRYAIVTVNDPNQPRTHLYRGLEWADVTGANANSLLNPLHGRIIDVERYKDPWNRTRYAMVVAMHPGGGWGVYRAQMSGDVATNNAAISDEDTHLIDIEPFDSGGGAIRFSGVWGDAWKSLNEVDALPAKNLISLGTDLTNIVTNFESIGNDRIGIFARSVRGNESLGYREEEPFYLASTTKIAVHARLWQLYESAHLDPNDVIRYGDPNDPFYNPAFADSAVPWYVDERRDPGLSTLTDPNSTFNSNSGQAVPLRTLDAGMMQVSDNAATSMLVKDPTLGMAWDSLDLNEWLSGLSGVGQGWGVVTSIQDVDALIRWQGQFTDDTREQISVFRAPRAGFETWHRGRYRRCSGNLQRCGQGTLGCPTGQTCVSITDPWGDFAAFLMAEGSPDGSPPTPAPIDYGRYYNMGLNTATPRALGMLQEKLVNGLYDPANALLDPNTTLPALTVMTEFSGLRNNSSPNYTTNTVTLPSHFAGTRTHTKGGTKGSDPCSDSAIYRFGPDAIVLNVLTENNSRGCGGNPGDVRDTLFFSPPNNYPTLADAVLRRLTADLVTCLPEDADFSPPLAWEGRDFDVSCEVSNIGGIGSPAVDMTFVAATTQTVDLPDGVNYFEIGIVRLPAIPAGGVATAQFSGEFPAGLPGNDYTVGWVVDSDRIVSNLGEVGEYDETVTNQGLLPGTTLTVLNPPPPPCPDADADGYADCDPGYFCDSDNATCGDCDDANGARYPGHPEICDQQDNDCNAVVDDGASRAWAAEVILEPDPDSDDGLGHAIARVGDVDGDQVSDFAVGVFRDDVNGNASGSVYLYSGATRERLCIATDPGGTSSDQLGFSVAGVGDVTGPSGGVRDGIPDFVAGVPFDDDMGTSSGSVVVFSGSDCSFARKLVDPDGAANDRLGESVVGLWTTATGDTVPDIAAGAPGSDVVDNNAGKVVVFSGSNGAVIAELTDAAQGEASDALGSSLAAFGEHTGGVDDTLVAGAPAANPGATNDSGRLVLFDSSSGTVMDRFSGPFLEAAQRMGDSVITLPDITGDGLPEIATGATSGDTTAGANRGRVYVLDGANGTMLHTLTDAGGGSGDKFGLALDWLQRIPGTLGDEIGIVVGAPDKNTAGFNAGEFFVFGAETGTPLASFVDPAGADYDYLGTAVAGVTDVNGDGYSEVAGGAPEAEGFESVDAGKILLYSLQTDCDGDGFTPWGGDCIDAFGNVGPGFTETCDSLDNDCDGLVDEDSDGDGLTVCDVGECDDTDPLRYNGATERCNGLDDDCDALIDEGIDSDADGWTTPCDCNDTDFDTNPSAADVSCDRVDQDCNGIPDNGSMKPGVGLLLTDPTGLWADHLGASVTAVGDVTGDGIPDVAAGIPDDDEPGTSTGRVAIFDGATRQLHCYLDDPEGGSLEGLGTSVAGIDDLNDDGVPDIVVGAVGYSVPAGNAGAVLVFSGATCLRLFKSSDTTGETNDRLGTTVAALGDLDGDGKREYAGGAPDADPMGLGASGRVIVFNGATGLEHYRLTIEHPRSGDLFGTAIARIGDVDADGVEDILIGAAHDATAEGTNAGSISVLSGVDGSFLYKVKDSPGFNNDNLGTSAVGLPDVDGDGVPDFAAGAPFDDDSGTNNGAVLIFSGAAGSLLHKVPAPGPATYQEMGTSLARLPDIDGDGIADLAAGAPGAPSGDDIGRVHLISVAGGTVIRTLISPDGVVGDDMGADVAVIGDTTGDGVPEIAAGAPMRDSTEDFQAGAVVLFTFESDCDGDGTGPASGDCDDTSPVAYDGADEVCDSIDNDCDGFTDEDEDGDGYDACTDCDTVNPEVHPGATEVCNGIDDNCLGGIDEAGPDLDGDGYAGPCGDCDETAFAVNPGATETCNAVDDNCDGLVDDGFSMPMAARLLADPAGGPNHNLGRNLAVVGDIDQDGFDDFAAGVPGYDTANTDIGAVLVYSGQSLAPLCRMTELGATSYNGLGLSVAGGVDLTGDGVVDVVSGAMELPNGSAGAVYLFSGDDCTLVRKMFDPEGESGDDLGESVAIIDDVTGDGVADIAAGAPDDSTPGILGSTGSVLIFSGDTGAVVDKILDPNPDNADRFGHAILPLGDVDGDGVRDLAVGVPHDRNLNGGSAGTVEIFSGADRDWLRTLIIPGGGASDRLGSSLALITDLDGDGIDDILAGAPGVYAPAFSTGVVVALSPRTGDVIRTYTDPLGASGNELGTSVAAVPDTDGDGIMDVLAGSPWSDAAGNNAGETTLFSGTTGTVLQRFTDPFAAAGDLFGTSVMALPGVTGGGWPEIVVGAPNAATPAGSGAGTLTVFSLAADCDGDGLPPLVDCDDADPAGQGSPNPAENVTFVDETVLSWSPPAGSDPGALAYDVIRSVTGGDFGMAAVCAETDDGGDTTAAITLVPGNGEAWFFLVRPQNRCLGGPVGTDSNDVERTVRTCP